MFKQQVNSLEQLKTRGVGAVALAIGVFDGAHLGHQLILRELVAMAGRHQATPVAMTFYPHPRRVLNPNSTPRLLVPPERKVELLTRHGAAAVVSIPFTKEFAAMSAADFIGETLSPADIKVVGVCVGKSWRFGRGGEGDADMLARMARERGFEFLAVDELRVNGEVVSSTTIRRAVAAGRLDTAAAMLGRPYSLIGKIIPGKGLATKVLDCPTANLDIHAGVIPPSGVYAATAILGGTRHQAVTAIGVGPTFHDIDGGKLQIEIHILDFNGDVYDQEMEVELRRQLREERCFGNVEELKQQISQDIRDARAALSQTS